MSTLLVNLLFRIETDHALGVVSAQVPLVVLQILIKIDKDFPVCSIHPPVVMETNRPIGDSFLCVESVHVLIVVMVCIISIIKINIIHDDMYFEYHKN